MLKQQHVMVEVGKGVRDSFKFVPGKCVCEVVSVDMRQAGADWGSHAVPSSGRATVVLTQALSFPTEV